MFRTLRNAFKIEDLRNKLFFTFMMLFVIRLGSQIPVPWCGPELLLQLVFTAERRCL